MNQDLILDKLTNNIIDYTVKIRERVYNNVREEMVNYYWNVGRMIVEEEQGGNITPEYGRKLYLELSKRLTKQMGKGYSRSNLFNMRNFYVTYPIVQTFGRFKKNIILQNIYSLIERNYIFFSIIYSCVK